MAAVAQVSFVRVLILECVVSAAVCMNGRSSCCAAARYFSLMQNFLRCERTQQENRIYRMGSFMLFAAPAHQTETET
ncbi:hypothetical protein E4Z66_14380 [Aliishimia ponticola]|uniref:Uncharacterized protein n=1 Tax=Aliishimia ponticola TaxID=2499833 RepID=A0A4S4NAG3_9RHOB|nr:hypothetical protein [Aliishimia ponticola]THH36229.1 hypothetical protein E4Z66_14380 [Aliishimia ponticola]